MAPHKVSISLVISLNTGEQHTKSVIKSLQGKEPEIKVFNNRDTLDAFLLNKDTDVMMSLYVAYIQLKERVPWNQQ